MVEKNEGRWVHTQRQIFLPSDSPHIRKHHLNWRLKAMQLIEESAQKNFHYSSVVSMSRADLDKFKELMIQTVGKARELIKSSKEEIVVGYNLDCFEL